jgi:hypothetical protein
MAPARTPLAHVVAVERIGWQRDVAHSDSETFSLCVRYSNGAARTVSQSITYAPGERERIVGDVVDAVVHGRLVNPLVAVERRRALVQQNVYAAAQRLPFIPLGSHVQAGA